MPPRHIIVVIFAFWVATSGWLFYRDLWPRLRPGAPPPFAIDLADEVSEQRIYWKLYQGDQEKGYAFSWVHYRPADDTFEVSSEFKLFSQGRVKQSEADQVVESTYRVTREGELRQITAELSLKPFWPRLQTFKVTARMDGRVDGGQFRPHLHLSGSGIALDRDLQPVAVSRRGSVLNPLQPLNRLQGVKPGQHWRMPLVDPLSDVLSALQGKPVEVGSLDADVLPEPQRLTWGFRKKEDACLVIVYRGEDLEARTWVRESDGLVLRQEVTKHGDQLVLQRD